MVEPVSKLASLPAPPMASTPKGSIYIECPKIHLRIESGANAALLRLVLEALPR